MTETDAANFKKEGLETDDKTFCIVEDDHNNLQPPPTKLRNPKLFRPFEMFIKMYGLPAYGEFDPTILIGITYSFLSASCLRDGVRAAALIGRLPSLPG